MDILKIIQHLIQLAKLIQPLLLRFPSFAYDTAGSQLRRPGIPQLFNHIQPYSTEEYNHHLNVGPSCLLSFFRNFISVALKVIICQNNQFSYHGNRFASFIFFFTINDAYEQEHENGFDLP
jgi:hypothetical protein